MNVADDSINTELSGKKQVDEVDVSALLKQFPADEAVESGRNNAEVFKQY